jgi:M6 family metalloprotease-like protein/uncharacterized repeat protein (TIGR02059 family)
VAGSPDKGEFRVELDGNPFGLDAVAVSESTVTLTLQHPVTAAQTVTVTYTPSPASALRDRAGNPVASLQKRPVTNTTGTAAAPTLVSATVDGTTVAIVFSEAVTGSPPGADFTVNVDGQPRQVSSVAVSGVTVTLTLAQSVAAGATVTLSYFPSTSVLRSASGQSVAQLTGAKVTNVGGGGTTNDPFVLSRPAFADQHGGGWVNPAVGEWPKKQEDFLTPTGSLRALMIMVDFSDAPGRRQPAEYVNAWAPSFEAWYREVSYGKLSVTAEATSRWYRMSRASSAYGVSQCCDASPMRAFVAEAVALVDADVDFSRYDALWVVASETPSVGILLYRPWVGEGVTADGKELRWGVTTNGYLLPERVEPKSEVVQAHNVMTHETGHLLGLPDLYGRSCPTCPDTHDWVGVWDIMDRTEPAAHFLAWSKWLLGWLDRDQLRAVPAAGQVEETLQPIETGGGVKAIVAKTTPSLAYVVEVRQKIGEDADLCDTGVLVYTVDSSVQNGFGPVRIQPAQTGDAGCGPNSKAAYDLGTGEVSTFEDAAVKVELLAENADGSYRVRVTRKS